VAHSGCARISAYCSSDTVCRMAVSKSATRLGFRVRGLWFGVRGSGFRVRGFGFQVLGSGFRVQGSGFGVWGLGFRVHGSGCRVQGLGFRVQGSGLRAQGSGFRGQGREGSTLRFYHVWVSGCSGHRGCIHLSPSCALSAQIPTVTVDQMRGGRRTVSPSRCRPLPSEQGTP